MPRSKSSVPKKARHKKVLKKAKGYYGKRKNLFTLANQSVTRSGAFAFAHRKKKKGEIRATWHIRIGAALAGTGLNFSRFMFALKKANVTLDRKVLAYLAAEDLDAFRAVVESVKSHAAAV